jgi:hypothetical protein
MQLNDVRRELAVLWQGWLERVLAALLAGSARSTDSQAAALGSLQLLQQFLPVVPEPPLPLAEAAPRQQSGGVSQLCELLQCQAHLREEAADATEAARAALQQHLQQALLQVSRACRHSDWTLAGCIASGLARQCRELTLLGTFAGDAALAQQLAALEARLLLWHAAPQPPVPQQLALVQRQLLALTRGRTDLCRVLQLHASPPAPPLPALPADLAPAECVRLATLLQPALVPGACCSETLMFACYRLAWVLQALGQQVLAELGLLLYQLLVQHWQQRAALLSPQQVLLAAWLEQVAVAVGSAASTDCDAEGRTAGIAAGIGGQADKECAALRPLLAGVSDAVACWPHSLRGSGGSTQGAAGSDAAGLDSVLLAVPAARHSKALDIRQLPEYLAASLSALLQVDAAWFVERSTWLRCADVLQEELQLLEQGAAALRLVELEGFCSLLLAVHVQLQANLPQGPWPGDLLWRAHHELVLMLDRAALWLEPQPAVETLRLLGECLHGSEECCLALLRTPRAATPVLRLACAMALFAQQAGRLLGRPLRIRFDAPASLREDFEPELLRTLQEILRCLLLQHESSAELRRSQRQALATTIVITLVLPDDAACEVSLLEIGSRGLPGGKALQRLQRSLAPAAQALYCEEVPRIGRRVQYRVSAASLQRSLDQRYRGERPARQN